MHPCWDPTSSRKTCESPGRPPPTKSGGPPAPRRAKARSAGGCPTTGGRGGNPDLRPGVPCAVEPVAKVFDRIGKSVKVPVLFHYAENDRFFNPATSKLWFDRFVAAGAQGEYVMQPAFGKDGHYLFSELVGVRYWLPAVEKFFARHNI